MAGPDDPVSTETPIVSAVAPEAPATAQPDPSTPAASPASGVDTSLAPDAGPTPATETPPTLLAKFDAEKKVDAPVAETKPAEEKPAAEVKPAVEAEKPAAEAVVADAKPAAEAEKPAAEIAPVELAPIDYFAADVGVKIPDSLKMDDAQKGEFTTALDAFRKDPSAAGAQHVLDMGAKAMQSFADHMVAEQRRIWNETNQNWVTAVMADPILGGAGHNTQMGKIAYVRDSIASNAAPGTPRYEQEMAEFNAAMELTGAGNNPAILRAFHNASRYIKEAGMPPNDGKPPKDAGKNPARRGLGSIYTHPTSNPEN